MIIMEVVKSKSVTPEKAVWWEWPGMNGTWDALSVKSVTHTSTPKENTITIASDRITIGCTLAWDTEELFVDSVNKTSNSLLTSG